MQIQEFFLIFIRISTFIVICPGFSWKGMPNLIKVDVAAGISLAVYATVPGWPMELSFPLFLLVAMKELLVGAALGYISLMFFSVFEMAGGLADVQVGFSMAEVFDPSLGMSGSYFGKVYYWVGLAVFFLTDLHLLLLKAVAHSFQLIPLTGMVQVGAGAEGMVKFFGGMLETALLLAAPLVIVALLTELVLAALSRTVPQINVLILSMPLKVIVALVFTMAFLPVLIRNIAGLYPDLFGAIKQYLESFSF